jgi:hypothetical protein
MIFISILVADETFLTAGDYLNDLWAFDGQYWIWMGGDSETNVPSQFNDPGVISKDSYPGGRILSVASYDPQSDSAYLFGGKKSFPLTVHHFVLGYGWQDSESPGEINDLWKISKNRFAINGNTVLLENGDTIRLVESATSVTGSAYFNQQFKVREDGNPVHNSFEISFQ